MLVLPAHVVESPDVSPLEYRPKRLDRVRGNLVADVFSGRMAYPLVEMAEPRKAPVRHFYVGVDQGAGLNIFSNGFVQGLGESVLHREGNDLAIR